MATVSCDVRCNVRATDNRGRQIIEIKNKVILLYSDGSFSSLKQIYSIDVTEVQVKEWQRKGIITKYWV